MADLSLVPTDELLEALGARFEAMVFSGHAVTGRPADNSHQMWEGHSLVCVGLAATLIRDIQDWERAEDKDDDEDA